MAGDKLGSAGGWISQPQARESRKGQAGADFSSELWTLFRSKICTLKPINMEGNLKTGSQDKILDILKFDRNRMTSC
jgi:hypothetical protein